MSCAYLGLPPEALPEHFNQRLEGRCAGPFQHHAYSWQVVVFMKFGIGKQSFNASVVTDWAVAAMPDRVGEVDGVTSLNGFTRIAAVLHIYLRNLAAQGLLVAEGGPQPETVQFRPRFAKRAEFIEHLYPTAQQKKSRR